MSDGIKGTFPFVIAQGQLDGTAGTPTISGQGLFGCSTPVSTGKGVYTIILAPNGRPSINPVSAGSGYVMKVGSTTASVVCAVTGYVPATGVLTFTTQTSDTKAAAEAVIWFELSQSGV